MEMISQVNQTPILMVKMNKKRVTSYKEKMMAFSLEKRIKNRVLSLESTLFSQG